MAFWRTSRTSLLLCDSATPSHFIAKTGVSIQFSNILVNYANNLLQNSCIYQNIVIILSHNIEDCYCNNDKRKKITSLYTLYNIVKMPCRETRHFFIFSVEASTLFSNPFQWAPATCACPPSDRSRWSSPHTGGKWISATWPHPMSARTTGWTATAWLMPWQ